MRPVQRDRTHMQLLYGLDGSQAGLANVTAPGRDLWTCADRPSARHGGRYARGLARGWGHFALNTRPVAHSGPFSLWHRWAAAAGRVAQSLAARWVPPARRKLWDGTDASSHALPVGGHHRSRTPPRGQRVLALARR
jgi:hypothetical protein